MTEYFPDGTEISEYFETRQKPNIETYGKRYIVTEYGIRDDGKIYTAELQKLIERVYTEGGGVIVIPEGVYRTGALFFKQGVNLYIEEDGTLLGSDDIADYPIVNTRIEGENCKYFSALINVDGVDGFKLGGRGTIDGNGWKSWRNFWIRREWNPNCTNKDEQRPRLLYLSNCKNAYITGVTMQNSHFWTNHIYKCDHIKFIGLRILSPGSPENAPSTDAIDIDVCSDIHICNCYMAVNDDAVALKGGKGYLAHTYTENGGNERIIIEDCEYGFCHSCITFGSESLYDRNIIMRRIKVSEGYNLVWLKFRPDTVQHFEYCSVSDVVGKVDNFLNINKWEQFAVNSSKEHPLRSKANNFEISGCRIKCKLFYNVPEDTGYFELSDFLIENIDADAEEMGKKPDFVRNSGVPLPEKTPRPAYADLLKKLQTPPEEFSPLPFWFWNDELSEDEILRQMTEMKAKGVNGFVIHPRKGLPGTIGYLSEEYFRYVRFAVQKAKEMDMKVVLYDEAMYPSGSCHGEVVKANPEFASKGLIKLKASEEIKGKRIAEGYVMVESGGTIRGVHEEEDDGELFAPRSADLLNPGAVETFIHLTHDKYYSELKDYFGSTIIAFFTDEPNILGRCVPKDIIPWSDGIYEEFLAAGGKEEDLGLLFDKDAKNTGAVAIYRKVIHERMSNSYYSRLSIWCRVHGIELTGHPEKSTDIGYLEHFGIPCQDVVWRYIEPEDGHAITGEHSTMGKCSSDSARHRGKRRNGNECFGCCGEREDPKKFTADDMRWYLNWLFVRGVNLVYPHAFYYSIREDRGDERPPEVGMNNPYWPHYRNMSDFIKRMCYLNTDSVNYADVAILCNEDELSWQIAEPLFKHQIEFNYLERSLLKKCRVDMKKLVIAKQRYSVLVATKEVLEGVDDEGRAVLQRYKDAGGMLITVDPGRNNYDHIQLWEKLFEALSGNINIRFGFYGENENLRFSHQYKDGLQYLLLTNEGMKDINFEIKCINGAMKYRLDMLWNPFTNETALPQSFTNHYMRIAPNDLWVVFVSEEV